MKRFLLLSLLIVSINYSVSADSNVSIVIYGDSNTTNSQEYEELQDRGKPWVDYLSDQDTIWNTVEIINTAKWGHGYSTTYLNPTLLRSYTLDYCPSYMFLALGGVDFLNQVELNSFNQSVNWTLSYLQSHYTGEIIVTNIIWAPLLETLEKSEINRFEQFQHVISSKTESLGLEMLDLYSMTLNQSSWFLNDNHHLNEEGSKALSKEIHDQLSKLIDFEIQNEAECYSEEELASLRSKGGFLSFYPKTAYFTTSIVIAVLMKNISKQSAR